MCYCTLLLPKRTDALLFDHLQNNSFAQTYNVLSNITSDNFDSTEFTTFLSADSASPLSRTNSEGFVFGSHKSSIPNEPLKDIIDKRSQRLKSYLTGTEPITFVYYARIENIGTQHMSILNDIHNLYPSSTIIYLDRYNSVVNDDVEWLKTYKLNLNEPGRERQTLVAKVLELDIFPYTDKERESVSFYLN